MPQAETSTSTSPAAGTGTGTSSRWTSLSSPPCPVRRTARMVRGTLKVDMSCRFLAVPCGGRSERRRDLVDGAARRRHDDVGLLAAEAERRREAQDVASRHGPGDVAEVARAHV